MEQRLLSELIGGYGFKLESVYKGMIDRPMGDRTRKQNHYFCTLSGNGMKFSFDYYMGRALEGVPDLKGVVSSLLLDASCYMSANDILDFKDEFCEGCTSKETRDRYNGCKHTFDMLQTMMGVDAFNEFMEAENDI